MVITRLPLIVAPVTAAALVAVGCGGSSGSTGAGSPSSASGSGSGPGALSPEVTSAATGDIPDNQSFLTFVDRPAGYSIRYPEGWAQQGSADLVTFRDKNNLVRVAVTRGSTPTVAEVAQQLTRLKARDPSLQASAPRQVTLRGKPMVKVTYTTRSAPNPVTGKRVTLMVDRYELARGGKRATVDLGTPKGVDNVDAYRMMIESFTWR